MTGASSILAVALLPWLTLVCSKPTAAPYGSFETGSSTGRQNMGMGGKVEGRPPQQQQNPIPPRFYRTLSRRSVGRYVLATSSLFVECARVYAPAPFGSFATSLCNRFNVSFAPHGTDPSPSSRHKKASAFSYDRFMSQNDLSVEEDLSADGDAISPPVPHNKYSRVSASFLVRHEIGLDKAGRNAGNEDTDVLRPPAVEIDEESENAGAFTQLKKRKTRNVFKSLAGLGRDNAAGMGDDLELLSDLEGEREWDGMRGEPGEKVNLAAKDMPVDAEGEDVVRRESTFHRNRELVDEGSDDFSSLVKKLRLAEKAKAKGDPRGRRKNRRSRSRNKTK